MQPVGTLVIHHRQGFTHSSIPYVIYTGEGYLSIVGRVSSAKVDPKIPASLTAFDHSERYAIS